MILVNWWSSASKYGVIQYKGWGPLIPGNCRFLLLRVDEILKKMGSNNSDFQIHIAFPPMQKEL